MSMTHELKLYSENFDDLINGKKIREYRLYDEKRRLIQNGDTLRFLRLPDKDSICYAKVKKVEVFPDWEECYSKYFDLDFKDTYDSVRDVVLDTYQGYYSEEDSKKYGCCCITLENIRNNESN